MPHSVARPLNMVTRSLMATGLALLLSPALGEPTRAQEITSEYFDIALVHDYREVWTDRKTGATRSVRILRPIPPAGFSSLGDIAVQIDGNNYDIGRDRYPYTFAIRAKAGYGDLLKGALWAGDIWRPKNAEKWAIFKTIGCPAGYEALGAMVYSQDVPYGDSNFACVKQSVLTPASWSSSSIWDDGGSKAKTDLSLWSAEYRGSGYPSSLVMPANVFAMATNKKNPPPHQAYALTFKYKAESVFTDVSSQGLVKPKLLGPNEPSLPIDRPQPVEYQVPFYQIKDPLYDFFNQWRNSPTYTIRRKAQYSYEGELRDNTDCSLGDTSPLEFTYATETGTEESSSWNWNASASISVTGTGGFKPLGVGGELSVGVTVTAGGGQEFGSSKSKSKTISDMKLVPKGTAMALFMLTSSYEVFRKGESIPMAGATALHTNAQPYFATYKIPGWTEAKPCPRAGILLSGPVTLERGKQYWSEAGYHYLMQTEDDLVVFTDSDNPIWRATDKLLLNGVRPEALNLTDDGRLMARTAGRPTIEIAPRNPNRPRGSALYLTAAGELQVVTPDGRVIWDSTTQ